MVLVVLLWDPVSHQEIDCRTADETAPGRWLENSMDEEYLVQQYNPPVDEIAGSVKVKHEIRE